MIHDILFAVITTVLLLLLFFISHMINVNRYRRPIHLYTSVSGNRSQYIGNIWDIDIIKQPECVITIQIGCKENTIEFWDNFFSNDETLHQNKRFNNPRYSENFRIIRKDYLYIRRRANKIHKLNLPKYK